MPLCSVRDIEDIACEYNCKIGEIILVGVALLILIHRDLNSDSQKKPTSVAAVAFKKEHYFKQELSIATPSKNRYKIIQRRLLFKPFC